ncbi:MAG: hypothetical protein U0105_02645 [Candidatus Obscuribacterales bacterium]
MRRFAAFALVGLVTLMAATPANAQYQFGHGGNPQFGYGGNTINSQQAQMQTRINRGVQSGRLNSSEAARLQSKLAQINQIEARMRMSGNRLSFKERQKLQSMIAQLNSDITRDLNDFERRRVGFYGNRHWR